MPKTGKKKATDHLLDVHNAITRRMHRQQHTAHMFICKHDLEQVWADHPLRLIFPTFTTEEQESIRKHYICVLSILIYVGWTDMSRFRPLFLRETGRDDAHLPFNDLGFLGTSGQVFLSHQHAFKPVVIEEHNERHIQEISTEDRLPFIDEPETMGSGGYGSVTKRVIAPRCLWNKEDNKDNPEVCGNQSLANILWSVLTLDILLADACRLQNLQNGYSGPGFQHGSGKPGFHQRRPHRFETSDEAYSCHRTWRRVHDNITSSKSV